jgi:hypothetical protein
MATFFFISQSSKQCVFFTQLATKNNAKKLRIRLFAQKPTGGNSIDNSARDIKISLIYETAKDCGRRKLGV